VCVAVSEFFQITVSPTLIVTSSGTKKHGLATSDAPAHWSTVTVSAKALLNAIGTKSNAESTTICFFDVIITICDMLINILATGFSHLILRIEKWICNLQLNL
jgi:hypothetical protein